MGEFLTSLWPLGATILVILGAAVLVALVVVLVRVAKTMKNVNVITQEAEEKVTPALKRIDPLVDRVELTIDTANLELLRVDAILEDVESVTDVAGKTADTVNNITTAPTDAVTSVVERLRGTFASRRKNKAKESRIVYPIASRASAGKHSASKPATAASAGEKKAEEAPDASETSTAAPTYDDLKRAAQTTADEIAADAGEESSPAAAADAKPEDTEKTGA